MNRVYLSLGTNLGNKLHNLRLAINEISKLGELKKVSSVYQTPAWGFESHDFYNLSLELTTTLFPFDLLQGLQSVEQQLGRTKKEDISTYQARLIDIDMLFFNDEIINTPELTVPHPRIHMRNFVLIPTVEIAAYLVHPTFNQTIQELLDDCTDDGKIEKLNAL